MATSGYSILHIRVLLALTSDIGVSSRGRLHHILQSEIVLPQCAILGLLVHSVAIILFAGIAGRSSTCGHEDNNS